MFNKLFKEYMKAKHHYYETQMDRIGGSKIHVPIPTSGENKGYGLAALVHSLWGSLYLAQPHKILRVSDEKVEYLDYTAQTENLRAWKGPLFDQIFVEHEERVLEISIIVFKLYISDSRTEVVEEYAEKFRAITPPEFIDHYRKLNPHFLKWLYQTNIIEGYEPN